MTVHDRSSNAAHQLSNGQYFPAPDPVLGDLTYKSSVFNSWHMYITRWYGYGYDYTHSDRPAVLSEAEWAEQAQLAADYRARFVRALCQAKQRKTGDLLLDDVEIILPDARYRAPRKSFVEAVIFDNGSPNICAVKIDFCTPQRMYMCIFTARIKNGVRITRGVSLVVQPSARRTIPKSVSNNVISAWPLLYPLGRARPVLGVAYEISRAPAPAAACEAMFGYNNGRIFVATMLSTTTNFVLYRDESWLDIETVYYPIADRVPRTREYCSCVVNRWHTDGWVSFGYRIWAQWSKLIGAKISVCDVWFTDPTKPIIVPTENFIARVFESRSVEPLRELYHGAMGRKDIVVPDLYDAIYVS